jgi:hypothetical protein
MSNVQCICIPILFDIVTSIGLDVAMTTTMTSYKPRHQWVLPSILFFYFTSSWMYIYLYMYIALVFEMK